MNRRIFKPNLVGVAIIIAEILTFMRRRDRQTNREINGQTKKETDRCRQRER